MAQASFFKRVYELVGQIPRGKVSTYGQIAALLGTPHAARTVGWAMRSTPEEFHLPCHRVVKSSGELPPDSVFGPGEQRRRLEEEGVHFRLDGSIDMNQHLWEGPGLK